MSDEPITLLGGRVTIIADPSLSPHEVYLITQATADALNASAKTEKIIPVTVHEWRLLSSALRPEWRFIADPPPTLGARDLVLENDACVLRFRVQSTR